MTHLINRLQFDVKCADEAQAFNLRHNFAVTFQEQIIAVVDAVCSEYVSEEEWLKIDKMDIDLGHFAPYALGENFTAVFKYKFEQELREKLSGIAPAQKMASQWLSKAELFQYFLRKGILPWWADEAAIDMDEIGMELLLRQPEVLSRFFYQNCFKVNVWKRVSLQLNREAKASIIQLVEELSNAKAILQTWLQQLLLLIKIEEGNTPAISDDVVDNIILLNVPILFHHPNSEVIVWQIMEGNIARLFEGNTIVQQVAQDNKALLLEKENAATDYSSETKKGTVGEVDNALPSARAAIDTAIIQTQFEEEEPDEKYFVKHSGIVLLALFLKRFFTNLHLLHDGEWKDKAAQYKAIHLLRYVSTGEQGVPEYVLTLEKIMCGMAIEEPVPKQLKLNEEETNEAEMLLQSVIEHWKALKHTSVGGLREAFLKRDGLLKKVEKGWLLQVERKTLDVLIDSIPWGYSTITFTWNTYPIYVEW